MGENKINLFFFHIKYLPLLKIYRKCQRINIAKVLILKFSKTVALKNKIIANVIQLIITYV